MTSQFDRASLLVPFSHRAGLSLAAAANLAYANAELVRRESERWGLKLPVQPFDKRDTQGFFAGDDDLLILSFRGTESNFGDWLRNLRVLPTDHEFGRAHRGFSDGLDAVWEVVVKPTLLRCGPGRQVWLTGHSLGAALATLAAARASVQLPTLAIAGIVTFGQPRLASRAFREAFDTAFAGRFHRYVNDRDIVARIPPGYRHVGELIHFDDDGDIIDPTISGLEMFGSDDDTRELTEVEYEALRAATKSLDDLGSAQDPDAPPVVASAELEGLIPGLDFIEGIRDHSMVKGYIPALSKNAIS